LHFRNQKEGERGFHLRIAMKTESVRFTIILLVKVSKFL